MNLDAREIAAILAGLRLLQQKLTPTMDAEPETPGGTTYGAHFEIVGTAEEEAVNDILTNGGQVTPLRPDEIDDLCERINGGNRE